MKTQLVEQALSHSITLKMNPTEIKERADIYLKQNQSYTLGKAIKIAIKGKLYNLSLQDALSAFLLERNWLIHKVVCGNEEDLNTGNLRKEIFDKIKSVSNMAEGIQRSIEKDMIDFCTSKGKDMLKIRAEIKSQEQRMGIKNSIKKT